MATTNQERVGKALDLLKDGLAPFVERELKAQDPQGWLQIARSSVSETQVRLFQDGKKPQWDAASLLSVVWNQWNTIFKKTLGQSERTLVSELRDARNRWAHQNGFSSDDADRTLDSIARLLTAVSAPQADEVQRMKMELRRLVFDEQVRSEKRRVGGSLLDSTVSGAVKPWRELVTPHPDVASGAFQQAEFAADLWQVHLKEGADEYRDPKEFFRRTYLTQSLRELLVKGIQRLAGKGGDPIVQLQTNFGGGKTHSMLALYHLLGGTPARDLPGVETLLAESGVKAIPSAKRVVLVGTKLSPGNPSKKPDGTVVHTLWGELAWQLGGKKAYSRIKADDERATSPGDVLRELFAEYGPCLILVDEWVAYARQLHDSGDLPGGTFETQFSFAQALTESAKGVPNCLLVVSLPASDSAETNSGVIDDIEVGGQRGREALVRLRNVIGRLESVWRPATAEEGFEIVQRRLFQPIASPEHFKGRDVTARAFAEHYRQHEGDFPTDCRKPEYEQRIKQAFPIHPEVFDRLYSDWSSLAKFQRTRGVLRLMAAVIHSLWEAGDQSPLILPASVPIDDRRVQYELTRYLSDNWVPIIEKDVDGTDALPRKIDREVPALGRLSAARRVARTVYLGSAPTVGAAHVGLEDRQVKLGCAMPGESPALFGDALRRLAATATYLYQDGTRVWYSTQPTVTKLADDRAEEYRRRPDDVLHELEERLRADLRRSGDFVRVHLLPRTPGDVTDEHEARLVVLGPQQSHAKDGTSAALTAAEEILALRGAGPRVYRNSVVFLAPDRPRMDELDEGLRRFLAWDSIVREAQTLDLRPNQVKQAETQRKAADATVNARLPEAYKWVIVPVQAGPRDPVTLQALKASSGEGLAARAGKKLKNDELLIGQLGAAILRKHLDEVPLWRGDSVEVRQLVEDFAQYVYLPRLTGPEVLAKAVSDGLQSLTWRQDTFAIADGHDAKKRRYLGLRAGQVVHVAPDSPWVLVKSDVAVKQLAADAALTAPGPDVPPTADPGLPLDGGLARRAPGSNPPARQAHRFFGTVELDPQRVGLRAGQVGEEVIAHLAGLPDARVRVTIEIHAELPGGVSDSVVRTVMENARTLKFTSQEFE